MGNGGNHITIVTCVTVCRLLLDVAGTKHMTSKFVFMYKNIMNKKQYTNQSISDFMSNLQYVLNATSDQKLPCIIAGGINIDLSKCNTSNDTAAYVDYLSCIIFCL